MRHVDERRIPVATTDHRTEGERELTKGLELGASFRCPRNLPRFPEVHLENPLKPLRRVVGWAWDGVRQRWTTPVRRERNSCRIIPAGRPFAEDARVVGQKEGLTNEEHPSRDLCSARFWVSAFSGGAVRDLQGLSW